MFKIFGRKVHANPQLDPNDAVDVRDLLRQADSLRENADPAGALEVYKKALERDPKCLHAIYWLASLYEEAGDLPAAKLYCEKGLAIDPDQIGLLLLIGNVAIRAFDPIFALQCYERVAKLDPEVPDLDALMADQYCLMGRIEEGVAAFDRAIARNPDAVTLQSSRLFVLNYSKQLSPAKLFEEHRRWGELHQSGVQKPLKTQSGIQNPEKRLRVGYVSPDFREHPAAAFF